MNTLTLTVEVDATLYPRLVQTVSDLINQMDVVPAAPDASRPPVADAESVSVEDTTTVLRRWNPSTDDEDLAWYLEQLTEEALGLHEFLAAHPEEKFTGARLIETIEVDPGDKTAESVIAGTLGWPGRYAKRVGRRLPIRWGGATNQYWVEEDIGPWLLEAIRAERRRRDS